ncbi:uncharacterized protein LOC105793211 [Gossypium raimondii]|uniref:uncharacterized protein LOC105793211 n=1 Tax=Gossypium raimondii TaxID=29730 RepID=UPI00063AA5CD|nr:uncharacterized protein LOC105793211 [Gossypium raimondii]
MKFLYKNILTRFGTPSSIITDEGSHFDCKLIANALHRYGVKHKLATVYHPQTNGQVEISNNEIKKIPEKECRFFKLVYGNLCHLPVDLEHEAFWAIKKMNMDWIVTEHKLLELNEMEEFKDQAYENAKLYKEKTKRWHDKRIMPRQFEQRQQVLPFISRLKLFPSKLKSRWLGPFDVIKACPHGVVDIKYTKIWVIFKANGQRLKHYWGAHVD